MAGSAENTAPSAAKTTDRAESRSTVNSNPSVSREGWNSGSQDHWKQMQPKGETGLKDMHISGMDRGVKQNAKSSEQKPGAKPAEGGKPAEGKKSEQTKPNDANKPADKPLDAKTLGDHLDRDLHNDKLKGNYAGDYSDDTRAELQTAVKSAYADGGKEGVSQLGKDINQSLQDHQKDDGDDAKKFDFKFSDDHSPPNAPYTQAEVTNNKDSWHSDQLMYYK